MTATTEHQDRPEDHDPLCPRADLEQAWNGAECHCPVIRVLREVGDVDILTPGEYILERITEQVSAAHNPRCPQSDPDSSDNCHCELLNRRDKWGTRSLTLREAVEAGIVLEHERLCPPGLKATTPDRCTWCVTIRQAREEAVHECIEAVKNLTISKMYGPAEMVAPRLVIDRLEALIEEGTA